MSRINQNNNKILDKDKDYYLKELEKAYDLCIQNYKQFSEIKTIVSLLSLIPLVITSLISFLNSEKNSLLDDYISDHAICYCIIFICLVLSYFALMVVLVSRNQKQLSLYKRKIVLLRTILHIDYEKYYCLPNYLTVGASQPLNIKILEKFDIIFLYILWANLAVIYIFSFTYKVFIEQLRPFYFLIYAILSTIVLLFIYKQSLKEDHENWWFVFIKGMAFLLRVKLEPFVEQRVHINFLSIEESKRLKVDLSDYYSMLIEMEDSAFFKHKGVNYKRTTILILFKLIQVSVILKVILQKCKRFLRFSSFIDKLLNFRGGASTISQQYVRTNFIIDYGKIYRRKLIEILLSRFWLEKFFTKKQILNLYLTSVRFEKSVFGICAAQKFFFGRIITRPTKAQVFVLLDRLSNANSGLLICNITSKINRLYKKGILSDKDVNEILYVYNYLIESKLIKCNMESFELLKSQLSQFIFNS